MAVTSTCLLVPNQEDGVIRPANKIFSGTCFPPEASVNSTWCHSLHGEDVEEALWVTQKSRKVGPLIENLGREKKTGRRDKPQNMTADFMNRHRERIWGILLKENPCLALAENQG